MTTPRSFSAAITDIQLESREAAEVRWRIALSHTEFQPGDTGVLEAVSRSGTRIDVPILQVVEESGDIWHVVEKPLAAGTDVTCRISPRD